MTLDISPVVSLPYLHGFLMINAKNSHLFFILIILPKLLFFFCDLRHSVGLWINSSKGFPQ